MAQFVRKRSDDESAEELDPATAPVLVVGNSKGEDAIGIGPR
jgi:hypothetical protein